MDSRKPIYLLHAISLATLTALASCDTLSRSEAPPIVEGFAIHPPPASLAEVRAIRERMFVRVTAAGEGALARFDYAGINRPGFVETTLSAMDENIYGVWCYDTANLLAAAYREAGFEAVTINLGLETGLLTHAGTLVRVDGTWYYEDAYFNFEITEPFFEAIREARQGAPLPVAFGRTLERPVRLSSASDAAFFDTTPECQDEPIAGAARCNVDFTAMPFLHTPLWTNTFSEQESMGLAGNISGLFMLPIAVYDGQLYHTGEHPILREYRQITGCVGGTAPSCDTA